MIVVDANVMVAALISPTTQGDSARAAMYADDDWLAPAHMPLEVLRTLRKAALGGRAIPDDTNAAFHALSAMQITYVSIDIPLLQAVWAMRHNVSAYDAAYLAVAVMNDAPLITFDARLVKTAEQTVPNVQVVVP